MKKKYNEVTSLKTKNKLSNKLKKLKLEKKNMHEH